MATPLANKSRTIRNRDRHGMHIPESHRFQHYINYSYAYSHRHWLTPWKLRRLLTRGGEFLTSLDQTEIAAFSNDFRGRKINNRQETSLRQRERGRVMHAGMASGLKRRF